MTDDNVSLPLGSSTYLIKAVYGVGFGVPTETDVSESGAPKETPT